jgi:hypothetical protein
MFVCSKQPSTEIPMSNPNFPQKLDITPVPLDISELSDSPYDTSAQREFIEKYGIDGRVW